MAALGDRLRDWAKRMKRDAVTIYLAARDPRVPWLVRAFALFAAAYALSPIDLIPDVIPVIGYLDELVLLPFALWIILRAIDPALLAELRREADRIAERPVSRAGAAIVVALWLAAAAAILCAAMRWV